jgi:hypothetical protein
MSAPQFEGTSPLISDRYILTMIAGEDLTMGQAVYLSAAWTVKKTTGANMKTFFGICLTSAKSGSKISVLCRGLCRATAYGSIAAGDQLTSYSAGRIETDNATLNTTIIGMAVEAISSGGTGTIVLW